MDHAELASLEVRTKNLEAMQQQVDARLETMDQLQAVIVTMYAEMFAGIEALASVVAGESSETKQKLEEYKDKAQKALWGLLSQQTPTNVDDMDDETRAAMEYFVRGTQTSAS